jgi:ubiquinone biosynthesis protein Coq4
MTIFSLHDFQNKLKKIKNVVAPMPEIICVVRLSKLTKLMDNFVLTTLKQLPRNSMGH